MNRDGQALHILVINDSPEILALKREIFEEEGFCVTTRHNGEIDLEEILRLAPDLLVIDYSSETEFGLLHRLRADPQTEAMPVILCSGAIREVEEIKPQLDVMGISVVYKPFDIEDLVDTVRKCLGLNSQNSQLPRLD